MWREKLYEDTYSEDEREAEHAVRLILQHGTEWFRQSGGRVVWRGKHTATSRVLTQRVRTNRKPLNSDEETHEWFNQDLKRRGCVANRSNAAFVSGSRSRAATYGNLFVAIPMGKFNYTWSPIARDAYLMRRTIMAGQDEPNMFKCDDGSLERAITSGHEIMIACEQVILIPEHLWSHWVIHKLKLRGLNVPD